MRILNLLSRLMFKRWTPVGCRPAPLWWLDFHEAAMSSISHAAGGTTNVLFPLLVPGSGKFQAASWTSRHLLEEVELSSY